MTDRPSSRVDQRRVPATLVAGTCALLLVAGMAASSRVGPVDLPLRQLVAAVWDRVTVGLEPLNLQERLITEHRIPRIFLAAVIGGVLAVAGCVLQALTRNPLADPSILGGTSGASLGAVAMIVAGASGPLSVTAAAFVGAGAGFAATLALAWRGGGVSPLRLVLAGIAVSYLLSALTSMAVFRADDDRRLRSALFWQLGSVADASWSSLFVPSGLMIAGVVVLMLRARRLDALSYGDLTATALGISPQWLRAEMFVLTSLLTGAAVALAGGIGFVALVVPHAVRLLAGPRHAALVPLAALAGAAFLVWADLVGRVVAPPSEVPLGVVTALVGAPIFALLIAGRMRDDLA